MLVIFGAMGLFSVYVAGQLFVSGRYMTALGMAVFALVWIGGPTAYFKNMSLFIAGDRFGKTDLFGFRRTFARADYKRADWSGAGRTQSLKFIAKDGRPMFTINANPWRSDELLGFVRRLDGTP